MVTLSVADRYHLQFVTELDNNVSKAKWQACLYLPAPLAMGDATTDQQFFYRNLLQRQTLQPRPQSWLSLQAQLRSTQLRQDDGSYHLALAGIINHLCNQCEQADTSALVALFFRLIELQRRAPLHGTKAKRFRMARHVALFYFHQALLREYHHKDPHNRRRLKRLIKKVEHFAQFHSLRITADTDSGRERLLQKIRLSQRIINRPMMLERQHYRDGQLAQQLIFGIAAAGAMAFATAVAFATQRAFGNFTTPFFFSLVLSYIFKDRIKELGRQYLLNKYLRYFSQHKYRLINAHSKQAVFTISENFFPLSGAKLKRKFAQLKTQVSNIDKTKLNSVWCYRREYQQLDLRHINHKKFYDYLTLNLSRQLRLIPSEQESIWHFEERKSRKVKVQRVHTILVSVSFDKHKEQSLEWYRVYVSRRGIHRINPINRNKS